MMRDAFDRRAVHDALACSTTIPGVDVHRAAGRVLLLPQLLRACSVARSGPTAHVSATTLELADHILSEAKVAFVPGEAFGTPGYARFSFAMADADMDEGIRRIHQWVTA